MFQRILNPIKSNSFFLFGPRGTGKSTLLEMCFSSDQVHVIDLLESEQEDIFSRKPSELMYQVNALSEKIEWIVIDEVQKVPKLLDIVHKLIETTGKKFALTGSSARKLKHGVSNLLAGRAFINHLYPLTSRELGDAFNLIDVLKYGALPKIFSFKTDIEKEEFLRAYSFTYLKEEIATEQIVRKLDPFRNFLEIAAQSNGMILNYSKIARDVGVDTKTVQSYFQILEDTLVGFMLPAYHRSIRKQQVLHPKFYFFDTGIKRALERTLNQPIFERTFAFGNAFEHFIILEIYRLNDYLRKDWRFSYLRTKDDVEIDLVIDCPGHPTILIEIKSTDAIEECDCKTLNRYIEEFTPAVAYCVSRTRVRKKIDKVLCIYWTELFEEIGLC
jgi:predicted AAA+ superfamily ATPase